MPKFNDKEWDKLPPKFNDKEWEKVEDKIEEIVEEKIEEVKEDPKETEVIEVKQSDEAIEYQKRQAKAMEFLASIAKDILLKDDKPEVSMPDFSSVSTAISMATDRIIKASQEDKEEPEAEPTKWKFTVKRDSSMYITEIIAEAQA
jgi:hypothetical protein